MLVPSQCIHRMDIAAWTLFIQNLTEKKLPPDSIVYGDLSNRDSMRPWKDGSAVKSTVCTSREPGSVPSTHIVSHRSP